jgi:DNA repair protein RecO (recombination protein O)
MPNKIETIEGYVIQANKYKEKDTIITFLTEKAKKTILVRGGYKPEAKNHAATFSFNKLLLDINVTNPNFLCVDGSKTLINNTVLYENLEYSLLGQYADEVLIKFFQDEDPLPYGYYENIFKAAKNGFDPITLAFIFTCASINLLGLSPNVDECVSCGSKKNLVCFDLTEGGFICNKCSTELNKSPSSLEYLKVFRYGFKVKADQLERAVLPRSITLNCLSELSLYLQEQLGFKINSLDLLLEALK